MFARSIERSDGGFGVVLLGASLGATLGAEDAHGACGWSRAQRLALRARYCWLWSAAF